MTEGFQVPMVAWTLGVHTLAVEASPRLGRRSGRPLPNVILQARANGTGAQRCCRCCRTMRGYRRIAAATRTFRVYEHVPVT